jgi:hypothetical protein
MEGGIDDIIVALQKADYAERIAALAGQADPPFRAAARDG